MALSLGRWTWKCSRSSRSSNFFVCVTYHAECHILGVSQVERERESAWNGGASGTSSLGQLMFVVAAAAFVFLQFVANHLKCNVWNNSRANCSTRKILQHSAANFTIMRCDSSSPRRWRQMPLANGATGQPGSNGSNCSNGRIGNWQTDKLATFVGAHQIKSKCNRCNSAIAPSDSNSDCQYTSYFWSVSVSLAVVVPVAVAVSWPFRLSIRKTFARFAIRLTRRCSKSINQPTNCCSRLLTKCENCRLPDRVAAAAATPWLNPAKWPNCRKGIQSVSGREAAQIPCEICIVYKVISYIWRDITKEMRRRQSCIMELGTTWEHN